MPAESERMKDGLSRRQVLARGAVAAGVVWAAPVIRTATAYATSSAGTERPCINFYLVCIDPLGVRPVRFPSDSPGYDGASADVVASATSTTSTSSTTTTSSTTSTSSTTTTTTTQPADKDTSVITDGSGSNLLPTDTVPPVPDTAPPVPDTVAPPVDDLGLFPEPVVPGPVGEPAPEDPHVLAMAAAQGAADAGAPDNIPPGIRTWMDANPSVPIQYPVVEPMLTQSGDEAWAVLLAPVDGPDPLTHQCRCVKGWAQVKGKYAEFYLDPDPELSDEIGRRMIFPNPRAEDLLDDPTLLIENVIFVYCCPQ